MSLTLGPATESFLARIVQTLPYLHSDAAAIPSQHRDFWAGVQAKYAANHFSTAGDPKVAAAQEHLKEELQKALEEDNKASEEKPAEQPSGRTEPGVTGTLSDTQHGELTTSPALTDEELDRMTAPAASEEPKEGE